MKKIANYHERPHPSGRGGTQRIYRFDNGYGASVVQFYGSYGYKDGLWELAVIKYQNSGIDDFLITYETPITDDVEGYLSESDVDALLTKIAEL